MKTLITKQTNLTKSPITLADLVNTGYAHISTDINKARENIERYATTAVRVIAPKNCRDITIDLSKPDKPRVRYKITKNMTS